MVLMVSENEIGKSAYQFNQLVIGNINLVMIICNHCPYVIYRMTAISLLVIDYKDQVNCIAVNPNDAGRHSEDHPDLMPAFKEKWNLQCEYIYDGDQSIAHNYNAVCTPEFYVIDAENKIQYHGELDPSHTTNNLAPTGSSLRHALDLVLTGEPISWEPNPSFGCSIKWKDSA